MKLNENDKKLILLAKNLSKEKKLSGGKIREVSSALETEKRKIFIGVSMHLDCGIGMCSERSAISSMLSNSDETKIKTIVASSSKRVLPPCGSCRELIRLIDKSNWENTFVIISQNKKVKLKTLLPENWKE